MVIPNRARVVAVIAALAFLMAVASGVVRAASPTGEAGVAISTASAGTVGVSVDAGGDHTCGVKTDGTVACWGDSSYGQTNAPAGTFSALSADGFHSCGVKTDGTIECWGDNSFGQLGAAPAAPSPVPPPEGKVGTAYSHTFTSGAGSPPASFAVSAGTLPPGLSLSGAGVLSGTPTTEGEYAFTVTASNGFFADATSEEFAITISLNAAPAATDDAYSTNEDAVLDVAALAGVLANDTDADEEDTLTAELVDDVANGTLTLNSDGSFRYEPDADFNGTDTFTYKAKDGKGGEDTANVEIAVNAAPKITVVAGSGSQSACLSDTRGRTTLKLSDVDNSAGTLTLGVASSSNTGLVPKANVALGGSGETRTATITTVSGRTGGSSVRLRVSDGQASTTTIVTVKAGGNGGDTLGGTGGADLLLGQNGDDTLSGVGGSDVLCGANGDDRLRGGSGADSFDGGSGTDTATDFNTTEGDSTTNIP